MKNFTFIFRLFLLVGMFSVSNLWAAGDPANVSGTGTEEDPFLIGSVADLKEIGNGGTADNFRGAYYKFIADVDFEGADQLALWHNNGFVGHIDGNGFSIKNVRISGQGWLQSHLGVFWNFQGTIKNLGFENVKMIGKIHPWNETSNPAVDQGIISNALFKNSQVENCWAVGCEIIGTTGNYAGGLFGVVQDSVTTTITNCFADVAITGDATSGGIAGMNGGTISKVAFYGSLPATLSHSIALTEGEGSVADAYYKTEAAPENVTTGSVAIATADLLAEGSYPAFDFVARPGWEIGENYAIIKLTNLVTSNVSYTNVGTKNDPRNPDTYTNEEGLVIYPPLDSTGYVFEGWYTNDASGTKLQDTLAIGADPDAVGDVVYYANWVALAVYNLSYENMGDVSPNNPATFQNDTAVTLVDVADFKGDSVFIGWFMDSEYTTAVGSPAIEVGATSDYTFYAKWKYRPFLSGGDGTAEDPYQVATVYDLQNLGFYGGWHHFILMDTIDMDGEEYVPLGNLSGVFDGDSMIIQNLTINGKGFVGQLSGIIKNLGLEDVTVNGAGGVGALVGAMWDDSSEDMSEPRMIDNCYVLRGTVTGTANGVGGLVGYAWTKGNTVRNCYADVEVNGPDEVGGLFGRTSFKDASGLSNCAFYGTVTTTGASNGAIFGSRHGSSVEGQLLANSFYYIDDITSATDQEGAVGIAWEDLSDEASYPALDFENTWEIKLIDEETEKECAVLQRGVEEPVISVPAFETMKLDVYPNPSTGLYNFYLENNASVIVRDMAGRTILKKKAELGLNSIDLSDLNSGFYMLTVEDGKTVGTVKLSLQ